MRKKTAMFLRDVSENFKGTARLYRVKPKAVWYEWPEDSDKRVRRTTRFIVTAATEVPYSGPETYIFPADRSGKVKDWGELEGSYKGGLDHDEAIQRAGYTLQALQVMP